MFHYTDHQVHRHDHHEAAEGGGAGGHQLDHDNLEKSENKTWLGLDYQYNTASCRDISLCLSPAPHIRKHPKHNIDCKEELK
jgi:hypothetical protein